MTLCVSSKAITGVNVGRPSVRCAAVPHVHFTPPAINPARAPATEIVSFIDVAKPFMVVQVPYDLLAKDVTPALDDSEGRNRIATGEVRKQVTTAEAKANTRFDKPGGQKGTLGGLSSLIDAISGFAQQK